MKISKIKELEVLSIEENSTVEILIDGSWTIFKPYESSDNSWDLVNTTNPKHVYGLSCINIGELKALLLADFYTDIYKDINIKSIE